MPTLLRLITADSSECFHDIWWTLCMMPNTVMDKMLLVAKWFWWSISWWKTLSYLICQCLDMFCSRLAVGQLGKCLSNFQATNHNIRDLAGHPDIQCYKLVHLVYKGNQPKKWFIHVYVYTWFVKPCKLLRSVPHGTCFGFHIARLYSGRRSRSVLDAVVLAVYSLSDHWL
jgi:hypothetical protein